jgi:hypothetical protein
MCDTNFSSLPCIIICIHMEIISMHSQFFCPFAAAENANSGAYPFQCKFLVTNLCSKYLFQDILLPEVCYPKLFFGVY